MVISSGIRTALVLAVAVLCSTGCGSMQNTLQQEFTPQVAERSKMHTFQAASFGHAFLSGHMVEWSVRLAAVEDDLPPFFEALEKAGYRFELQTVSRTTEGPDGYEYHDVNLVLSPKSGTGPAFTLPGAPGTRVTDYVSALAPAARQTKIPAEVLRRGHFALFALDGMIGSLSATDSAIRRHVFGLLVLKEKLKKGEPRIDYLAPMRPNEKSIEDVDLALRVLSDHFAETSRLRAEALGVLAMVQTYEVAQAREVLAEQVKDSRTRAVAWESSHHQPTMEEYGVAMKELKLPTPENMLAVLDKDGYITAAIKIAQGVATGDASATVEGFGKLAPPNSALRIASEGAAAALKGDIKGTAVAVLALAEKQPELADVKKRLDVVEQAVAQARSTLAPQPPKVPKM